jgi:hypothetical protein
MHLLNFCFSKEWSLKYYLIMLLNNDIKFFFIQLILNFQKEINASMYIYEFFTKQI